MRSVKVSPLKIVALEKRNDTLMEIIFKALKALDVNPSSFLTIAQQVFSFSWVCFSLICNTFVHFKSYAFYRCAKMWQRAALS